MYRFRWVQCSLDNIKSCRQNSERRAALDSLPPNLPQSYKQILDKVKHSNPKYLKFGLRALAWLLYSKRPLNLCHLATAASIDPEYEYDEEQRFDENEHLFDFCKSLIRIDRETKVVELCHISVTQFLQSDRLPDDEHNDYFLDESEGHRLLLRACFMYLASPCFQTTLPYTAPADGLVKDLKRRLSDEFSLYAIYEWPKHAALIETKTCDSIATFLTGRSFPSWRELRELVILRKHRWWENVNEAGRESLPWTALSCEIKSAARFPAGPALYYSALFGLQDVTVNLLQAGHDPNELGGCEFYPFMAALSGGFEDLAELLLDYRPNINATCGLNKETLLHKAVREKNARIVQFLVRKKANCAIQNNAGRTPLHIATGGSKGSVEMERIVRLLSKRSNIDMKDFRGETALHLAAKKGIDAHVKILIHHKADVNALDHTGKTPLHLASAAGDLCIVTLLLDNGGKAEIADQLGYTALHEAVRSGNPQVVEKVSGSRDFSERLKSFNEPRQVL